MRGRLSSQLITESSRLRRYSGVIATGEPCFSFLGEEKAIGGKEQKQDFATIRRELSERVVDRFSRACGEVVVVADVSMPALERVEVPPPNPGHPQCARYADTDDCRESWQLHLAVLERCPRTHSYRCQHGLLCAVVPVVSNGRCCAAVKLVCPANETERRFECLVEVLDALVRDVQATGAALRRNPPTGERFAELLPAPGVSTATLSTKDTGRPLVLRAARFIEENLANPKLTVQGVAQALDVNASYLSHLFVRAVGRRMGRFIVGQRIEKAKILLASTNLQVKHIALDTGHANPSRFAFVFRSRTGMSPAEYRARLRRSTA